MERLFPGQKHITAKYAKKNIIGQKKALLIGINYYGTCNQLSGCINDVYNIRNLLINKLGYLESDIILMTDSEEQNSITRFPTYENVMRELQLLVSTLGAMDIFYFHFSGHGFQSYDYSGDEIDRRDENIVLLNSTVSDDLLRTLIQKINPYTKVCISLDSCHSGTMCDLPFRLVGSQIVNESGYLSSNIVMISSARDEQTAVDAYINDQVQGALSNAICQVLNCPTAITSWTWSGMLAAIRLVIKKNGFLQEPQLNATKSSLFHSVVFL